MIKTYQGSCHCGAVRFEAHIDLAQGTVRCNCSFCLKIRCWTVMVAPESFKLHAGQEVLGTYQFGARNEYHHFCRTCGVRPYGIGNSSKIGKFIGVSVSCLDHMAAEAFARLPVTYIDGANDQWQDPPAVSSHL